MKTYTQEELDEILLLHKKFLEGDETGKKADLSNVDLSFTDLIQVNLSNANLSGAILRNTNLREANLRNADLRCADLRSVNFRSTILDEATTSKRFIHISCIGSAKRKTTYCFDDDIIWCGCFEGTLDEFEKKVKETHSNNPQYLKEYLGFIEYVKSLK